MPAGLEQVVDPVGVRVYQPAAGCAPTPWPAMGWLRGLATPITALITTLVRLAAVVLFRLYLRSVHRFRVQGVEHLPHGQSFVLVANHTSHLDMFCLLAALPIWARRRVFPVIAQDYFWRPWTLLARWAINALPLDRRATDGASILDCERLLAAPNNILLMFPEGTRSSGEEPAEFRPGVAFLAAGREIPVVPCHIAGSQQAWPKGQWLPRPAAVCLTIGKPQTYAHLPRSKQGRRELCVSLRAAVIELRAPSAPRELRRAS